MLDLHKAQPLEEIQRKHVFRPAQSTWSTKTASQPFPLPAVTNEVSRHHILFNVTQNTLEVILRLLPGDHQGKQIKSEYK